MSTPPLTRPDRPTRVVWWRNPAGDRDLPRAHGIGWASADGTQIGTLHMTSPHRRLQPADVEHHLKTHLANRRMEPYEIGPALPDDPEISSLVRLAIAGHHITRADLATTLGLDAIGGVVAELTGRGTQATVLVEATLSPAIETAVADWAHTTLHHFATATHDQLTDHGWHNTAPGRWQLIARQTGTPSRW